MSVFGSLNVRKEATPAFMTFDCYLSLFSQLRIMLDILQQRSHMCKKAGYGNLG